MTCISALFESCCNVQLVTVRWVYREHFTNLNLLIFSYTLKHPMIFEYRYKSPVYFPSRFKILARFVSKGSNIKNTSMGGFIPRRDSAEAGPSGVHFTVFPFYSV